MGIPGFFGFLKKYNNTHNDDLDDNFIKPNILKSDDKCGVFNYHFFLDFNGAIYTAYYSKTIKTERALIVNTIAYLDTLVSIYLEDNGENMGNNLKTLFIALDGVPPRAKIQQQRTRRFHSVKEKKLIEEIEKQWGDAETKAKYEGKKKSENECKGKEESIDTTMITPGTKFMADLKTAIEKHLKTSELYKDIETVIFSSTDVPGEGEHKIFKYMKNADYGDNDKIIIYGLDADLIMLSMIAHINNIFLLREKTQFGSYCFQIEGFEFMYLDIDILKTCLLDEFTNYINDIKYEDIVRLIDDYVFLMFIIGNDFIPKIPHLAVYNNGLETLMKTYCKLFNHHRFYLVDSSKMRINEQFLYCLFDELQRCETNQMVKYHYKRERRRINMRDVKTEEERRKTLLKYLPLQYLNIEDKIKPSESGWRGRYYNICLNCQYNDVNKESVVVQYLESLVWTFHYYFGSILSWDWFYQYEYGPTCLDIYNYLEDNANTGASMRVKMTYDINKIKGTFNLGKPVKQQELLIMVLPLESQKYMINNFKQFYNNNDIIKSYFPSKYRIAIPYHSMYWECHPILPIINRDVIKKCMNGVYLTQDEQKRNMLGVDFVK